MTLPMIGLTGVAQSGKDTTAGVLARLYGYQRMAFADPLREMTAAIDPMVGTRPVWDAETKSLELVPVHYSEAVELLGYEAAKLRYPELRRFLQRIGTEYGRNLHHEDYWVEMAMARTIGIDAPVVFTDVRFPNEADAIVDQGGVIVRVERGQGLDGTGATHPSETAMADYPVHFVLDNAGDLTHLATGVTALVADIKELAWTA
jgi:hypothetical protein